MVTCRATIACLRLPGFWEGISHGKIKVDFQKRQPLVRKGLTSDLVIVGLSRHLEDSTRLA